MNKETIQHYVAKVSADIWDAIENNEKLTELMAGINSNKDEIKSIVMKTIKDKVPDKGERLSDSIVDFDNNYYGNSSFMSSRASEEINCFLDRTFTQIALEIVTKNHAEEFNSKISGEPK